jgi:hypothetical protein
VENVVIVSYVKIRHDCFRSHLNSWLTILLSSGAVNLTAWIQRR